MLMPKRVKWRKQQRGRLKGTTLRGRAFLLGNTGCRPSNRDGSPTGKSKRLAWRLRAPWAAAAKFGFAFFPDKPLTVKPAETRMGKGKGNPEYWVAVIKPGRIMFEIEGVPRASAQRAIKLASQKLPVKVRFVERGGHEE